MTEPTITEPDPRQARVDALSIANQSLIEQLARRHIQTEPVTFTDGKIVALVEVLAERGDPDLMLDVMLRYAERLNQVLTNALAQTSPILIAGQVPPNPNGAPR